MMGRRRRRRRLAGEENSNRMMERNSEGFWGAWMMRIEMEMKG
jgi:hypothetical protein